MAGGLDLDLPDAAGLPREGFDRRPRTPAKSIFRTNYEHNMRSIRVCLLPVFTTALLLWLSVASAHGQGITTSAISGTVARKDGTLANGVAVTIVHDDSGTRTNTVTRSNGQFNISGLRPGGPYTVTATVDGAPVVQQGVYLTLDKINEVDLMAGGEEPVRLEKFLISESNSTIFGSGKVSTGSDFSAAQVSSAPTVRNNVQDIARLDPRFVLNSLDQGGQLSAGGQNFRFNSFLIDGVQANDPFGLNSNGFSSLRSPIPLEAVQAASFDLQPYDVRRSGFTGALINVVTKSGTNQYHGSLYYNYSDQNLRAKNPVSGIRDDFKDRQFGLTFGGPIVKDRLFFFLAYDEFKREAAPPAANFVPDPGVIDAIVARAQALGYNAGTINATAEAAQKTYLGKLDWNISAVHRASFTYRKNDGTEPIFPSFTNTSQTSLSNYWYQQPRVTESYVGQLFSSWTPDFRTEATISYNTYDGSPKNAGAPFPEVTINGLSGFRRDTNVQVQTGSVRLGTEFSRQFNFLTTKSTDGSLIGEYSVGDHTLTLGGEVEKLDYTNKFVQAYDGSYTFPTLAAWQAGSPIAGYTLAKPFAGRSLEQAFALWTYTAYGAFLQDSWKPNSQFTLLGGLRLDYPSISDKPAFNPGFESAFGIRNDTTNSGNYTVSPRLGFSYEFKTERRAQLRGGIGLFQGKNPAVWISNAYSNTGALGNVSLTGNAPNYIPGLTFEPDPTKQVAPAGTPPFPAINVTDPSFKQPLIWKSNLALDYTLPFGGLVVTAEVDYDKTDKAPYLQYLNYQVATSGPLVLPDGRIRYNGTITPAYGTLPSTSLGGRRRVPTYADVFLLTNTSKGESLSTTLQIQRPKKNGWAASLAWTHGRTTEVSPMTSSTASSNYNLRATFNPNENVASIGNYDTRDRIIGTVTREFHFFRSAVTSVTLIYESRSGRPYSWVFKGDANGDGFSQNDLFYVPTGPEDTRVRWNSDTEKDAFFAFVNSTSLKNFKGKVAPRNSERAPWINTVDINITQEIPLYKRLHTELFFNVVNFANLFDKSWGIVEELPFAYRRQVAGTQFDPAANGGTGQYIYYFNSSTLDGIPTVADDTPTSRWQVLAGVRLKF